VHTSEGARWILSFVYGTLRGKSKRLPNSEFVGGKDKKVGRARGSQRGGGVTRERDPLTSRKRRGIQQGKLH